MKLIVIILFGACIQVSARGYSQITILETNTSLQKVFQEIQEQSGYDFVSTYEALKEAGNVTVNLQSVSLEKALQECLKGKPLTYVIIGKTVVIQLKEKASYTDSSKLIASRLLPPPPIEIHGRVLNQQGEPLQNASVLISGAKIGTTTNADGRFSLTVPNEKDIVLEISDVGYQTKKVITGSETLINVILELDVSGLGDVVVVGYGSRAKKDITTAISSINSSTIDKNTGISMTAESAMQGTMTGVRVESSGDPMGRPTVQIRGVNTWGISSPLYIIDGVPVIEYGAGSESLTDARAVDIRGPINIMTMINPGDIESISVLKDASAAAIYGVRAANGVILINTKKGKKGDKPLVGFNSQIGIQNIRQSTELMNTQQYTGFLNTVLSSDPTIAISPDNVGLFDASSPKYLGNSPTYNWQDAVKNKNALARDYSVRVSGGTEKTDYFVSIGSTNTEAPFKYNYLNRLSGSFKVNTRINKWLKLGANYRKTSEKGRVSPFDLVTVGKTPPWQPIYDPNGFNGYAFVVYGAQPDGTYNNTYKYGAGTQTNFLGSAIANDETYKAIRDMGGIYVELDPFNHLKIKGQMSMDIYNYYRYRFQDYNGSALNQGSGDQKGSLGGGNSAGNYEVRNVYNNNYIKELTISYNNTFGRHNIDLVFNGSDQQYNSSYNYTQSQYTQSNLPALRILQGDPKYLLIGATAVNSALEGLMGRASYNYNSTYYVDVTLRHDGSARFSKANRWGTFPSVSGAWRISREKFMKPLTFLNDLKLRAGYGQLGNQEVQDLAYLSPILNNPTFAWGNDPGNVGMGYRSYGATVFSIPNKDLHWEKTSTVNVGIDAVLLTNSLTMSLDYFNKFTDGILQSVVLPPSVGLINMPSSNVASVRNSGIELSLNYNNSFGKLKYTAGINFSTLNNIVEKTSRGIPLYNGTQNNIEEGYSMNYIRGYKVGGIFQSQTEIDKWKSTKTDASYQLAKIAPGDFYFQDLGSAPTDPNTFRSDKLDNKIDTYDQVYLGKTIPGYYYGFNINLQYENFDLNTQFSGVGDVQKINYVKMNLYYASTTGANESVDVLNAWTSQNHSTNMPRPINGDPAANYRFSDWFVENGAYLRLGNIQLGYTLPARIYNRIRNNVSQLRVYVGASNLFTLSGYKGYDPVNDSYPVPQTIFMGLNVQL